MSDTTDKTGDLLAQAIKESRVSELLWLIAEICTDMAKAHKEKDGDPDLLNNAAGGLHCISDALCEYGW